MAAIELAPVSTPLALFPSCVAQSTTTLIMKGSLFSNNEVFTICTVDGRDLFKINAAGHSFSHRKNVYDIENRQLFTLCRETLSIPKSYYAESMTGSKIFEIEGKWHMGSPKAIGHFRNALDDKNENLEMNGSWKSLKTNITDQKNGDVVAQIDRKFWNTRQLLADRSTYAVTIASGVDMAMIVAMVICLDERN